MEVLQAVVLGLLLGGVYAVMATGLSLMFGVMRVVNLAHGAFIVLGAYVAYFGARLWDVDPFVACLVAGPMMFTIGVLLYRTVFTRITETPRYVETTVLLTFGVALMLEGVMAYAFTGIYRSVNTSYGTQSFNVGALFVPKGQFYAAIASLGLVGLLWAFLYLTRTGYAVRATMQNRTAAQTVGVDVEWVSTLAFGIGLGLAGVSGPLMSYLFTFFPASHWDWVATLLSLIVVGGLGSLSGALVGGLLLAVASSLVGSAFGAIWSSLTFYLALFVILLVRQQGLFGSWQEA